MAIAIAKEAASIREREPFHTTSSIDPNSRDTGTSRRGPLPSNPSTEVVPRASCVQGTRQVRVCLVLVVSHVHPPNHRPKVSMTVKLCLRTHTYFQSFNAQTRCLLAFF